MDFLSTLVNSDSNLRPSYFELASLDRLYDVLRNSLEYVLDAYAQRYPAVFSKLAASSDGVFALVSAVIEWHYLSKWNSSFAENFYGLLRVSTVKRKPAVQLPSGPSATFLKPRKHLNRLGNLLTFAFPASSAANVFASNTKDGRLTPEQKLASLYFIVGHPYLSRKLKKKFGSALEDSKNLRLFRALKYILSAARIAYLLAYICGKTRYLAPWQHLLGIQVLRMTAKDFSRHDSKGQARGLASAERRTLFAVLKSGVSGSIELLKTALPVVLFCFKFLEWWYQSDIYKKLNTNSTGPVPPPPQPPKLKIDVSDLCPPSYCYLCGTKRTNPALLIDSGFVFCYPCIYKHLQSVRECPVSGIAVKRSVSESLWRLYEA